MSAAGTIRACPRSPALRRRGVPPEALREFVRQIGVAKANSIVDVAMFEHAIRDVLNRTALRRMAVLRPLKVVIDNYPEGQSEELDAVNHPDDADAGARRVRFGRELYVERDDFMENPPKKFFRLSPGREVRLRYAYFITCREVVKDAAGEAVELRCTYDPATRGGNAPDGRKVQATLHWVGAADAVPAEVRLYNPLFAKPDPDAGNFAADLNPDSLEVLGGSMVEPALAGDNSDAVVQFERQGYFIRDRDSGPDGWCSTVPSACATAGGRRRGRRDGKLIKEPSLRRYSKNHRRQRAGGRNALWRLHRKNSRRDSDRRGARLCPSADRPRQCAARRPALS